MSSKKEKIDAFDVNGPGLKDAGLFGLPFNTAEAEIIILPVPWDVTVSFDDGTSNGAEAILWASKQVDLYYPGHPDIWKMGISMEDIPVDWADLNKHYRKKAQAVIERLEDGADPQADEIRTAIDEVNDQCRDLVQFVHHRASKWLEQDKLVAVLGGDHSSPLGLIRALEDIHDSFGILLIDAHADLRKAYEGFTYSHASIMYNALQSDAVSKLVGVGIRDICNEEMETAAAQSDRIRFYFDHEMKRDRFNGRTWDDLCSEIIDALPEKVYISFDIDGLDPSLCPNTGTPVPGGLQFEEARYLVSKVVESGRTVIGFDLCEVAPSRSGWDTNVGARMLYHLCNQTGISNGKTS